MCEYRRNILDFTSDCFSSSCDITGWKDSKWNKESPENWTHFQSGQIPNHLTETFSDNNTALWKYLTKVSVDGNTLLCNLIIHVTGQQLPMLWCVVTMNEIESPAATVCMCCLCKCYFSFITSSFPKYRGVQLKIIRLKWSHLLLFLWLLLKWWSNMMHFLFSQKSHPASIIVVLLTLCVSCNIIREGSVRFRTKATNLDT